VCAALILATRPGDDEPDRTVLNGRTERGHSIELVFLDAKLLSFDTTVSFWCPSHRVWSDGLWKPTKGWPGTSFRQDDRRFRVREKGTLPDLEPPTALDYTMRGELADDERSASGTMAARAVFGRGHDSVYCRGTVSFRAD
jgi:hypothetical protein